jgi:Ca-activated chloride channel homolog
MWRWISGVTLIVTAAVGATAAAQAPTFKTGTLTVPLFATVTDATGRLVPDLTQEDFEIFDDKKPQAVTLFVNEVQPITVVVLLDESGSMVNNIARVKDAAEQFLLRLLPEDRARIGSFEDTIIVSPEFTNDSDALIGFLREKLQYGNGTRLWDAVDAGMTDLSGLKGRRVVLVFTDGGDDPGPGKHISYKTVLRRAQTEGYMVYAIGFHSRCRCGPDGQMIDTDPDPSLKKLAAESGGGYFELREGADLLSTFERVAEELHSQYVIGFTPENLDGKLHQLQVRVKRPGMTVRARRSYLASPDQ